uniref:Uncharacterized protein n=1 Tax=Meloidogyne enterolobii TaxID=390850 RepID=A0A6V7VNT9_MELEN|nr:unnamed protein product [Meloidogyne enterolobii]
MYNQQQTNPSQHGAPARIVTKPHCSSTNVPNVAAHSPAQSLHGQQVLDKPGVFNTGRSPQLGSVYSYPGSAGSVPFSPQQHVNVGQQHAIYGSQHLLQHQPQSQQMSHPLSDAPAPNTPSTPQQIPQPHSTGSTATTATFHTHQPGSVPQGSVGPPSSIPMQVGTPAIAQSTNASPSKQPSTSTQPPAAVQPDIDPIATSKMLILKDLRRTIVKKLLKTSFLNLLVFPQPLVSVRKRGRSNIIGASTTGGPHSNLGIGGPHSTGPHSNLGFGGPNSVNPHSVQNPLSVNPQSVSAIPPGSVKSGSATDEFGKKEIELSAKEQYDMAKNSFMNVCDNIENNMKLILEVNRQQGKLYNTNAGYAIATFPVHAGVSVPTLTLPNMLHDFTQVMNADKQAIKSNIEDLNNLMKKVSNGKN